MLINAHHSFTLHSLTLRLTVHFAEDRCSRLRAVHGLGLHGDVGLLRGRPWPAAPLLATRTRVPHGGGLTQAAGGTKGRLLVGLVSVTPGS